MSCMINCVEVSKGDLIAPDHPNRR
ncbi:hypothetical protein V3C99_011534 [Haemonchus contortus]